MFYLNKVPKFTFKSKKPQIKKPLTFCLSQDNTFCIMLNSSHSVIDTNDFKVNELMILKPLNFEKFLKHFCGQINVSESLIDEMFNFINKSDRSEFIERFTKNIINNNTVKNRGIRNFLDKK